MGNKNTKEEAARAIEDAESQWPPERIRALRHDLKMTQKQFAERVGVHVVTVIRWEGGSFAPSGLALGSLEQLVKTAR